MKSFLVSFFIILSLTSFSQSTHLLPIQLADTSSSKDESVRFLQYLFKGFKPSPYARFAVVYSLSQATACSVEQRGDDYLVISNQKTDKYLSSIATSICKIDDELYRLIGDMYNLAISKRKYSPMKDSKLTTIYLSKTFDGKIVSGCIWNAKPKSLMDSLVNICMEIYKLPFDSDYKRAGKEEANMKLSSLKTDIRSIISTLKKPIPKTKEEIKQEKIDEKLRQKGFKREAEELAKKKAAEEKARLEAEAKAKAEEEAAEKAAAEKAAQKKAAFDAAIAKAKKEKEEEDKMLRKQGELNDDNSTEDDNSSEEEEILEDEGSL